ncbi:MAG: M20/M25/M40 family metallo-hydrolase [Bradymonadia bacterium]
MKRLLKIIATLSVVLIGGGIGFGVWLSAAPGESFPSGKALPAPSADHVATAGRLKADTTTLSVTIGPRDVTHPKALKQAEDFIVQRFGKLGYTAEKRPFISPVDGGGEHTVYNIDATLKGTKKPKEVIVVGGHYDTVPGTPGADDNATGTAAMLELARRLKEKQPERTIRFVAFVNEEPPFFKTEHMGSLVYARELAKAGEQVVAMISLEMLGTYTTEEGSQSYPPLIGGLYPDRGDFIAFVADLGSRELAREAIGLFRDAAQFPSEVLTAPASLRGVDFSDHWSFWQAGYKGIMVTDTAFFRTAHYHEPTDTPDRLDFDRMSRVVVGMESVVMGLAKAK